MEDQFITSRKDFFSRFTPKKLSFEEFCDKAINWYKKKKSLYETKNHASSARHAENHSRYNSTLCVFKRIIEDQLFPHTHTHIHHSYGGKENSKLRFIEGYSHIKRNHLQSFHL